MIDPIFTTKQTKDEINYGEFVIEPLETGFGHTLGHTMRRVLLSSLQGAAITSVKISGVKHKLSEVSGLKENIVDFIINLKGLSVSLGESKETAVMKLSVKGTHKITGKDIQTTDGVEIANLDHYLGSLSGIKAKLDVEMTVEKGYGYSLAEERQADTLGVIATDAVFSPIVRVNYSVEATRVGRRTDMDKLILQIWTNGSITPKEALNATAKMLATYFTQIYQPNTASLNDGSNVATNKISNDVLKLTIDELDLPTRIYNSLRNGGIETLGELLQTPRKELISMRNMGAKSIAIIDDKLKEKGIDLTV